MTTALALYFLLLSAVLVAFVIAQYLRGTHDLFTLRNVALLGFIIFQVLGAVLHLYTNNYEPYNLQEPAKDAAIFAAWATVFVVLALAVYRWGFGVKWLAARVPAARAVPGDTSLLAMAGVLAVMGLAIRLAGNQMAILGAPADYLGTGYVSMAAALCGWVWAKRFINPVVIVYTVLIVGIGLVTVMYSSFGRRGLIAVGAGLLWGMYYGHLRGQRPIVALGRLAVVGIFPLIFVALYTSVRSSAEHDRTASQHVQAIVQGGDIKSGLVLLFEGQNVPAEGFWIIENYPERFPYRWFFTPRYAVEVAIPRSFHTSKPYPLSTQIAGQANVAKVNQDVLKLSPGILGSAAAEGGFIAVLLYAILAGLFLRFFDQLVLLNPHSPFVVLPVGSALGQVLGFARGETSVMVNAFVLATIGCWVTMLVVGAFVQSFSGGAGAPPDEDPDALNGEPEDQPDDGAHWPDEHAPRRDQLSVRS